MKYAKRIGRNVTVIKMNIEDINLTGTLFTLKSVPRDINHPVRIKIKEL
jgi:butyrate kinase